MFFNAEKDGRTPSDYNIQKESTLHLIRPQIVEGNKMAIADGDVTPMFADSTMFDSTSVMSGSSCVVYSIKNTGNDTLRLGTSAVTFGAGSTGEFTITSQPNEKVPPGDSTTFKVTFDPSTGGEFTDTIKINSNDADENPYNYVITGVGLEIMYASANDLNFSDPCSCTDPLNCEQGGIYYFHDTLKVTPMPPASGLNIAVVSGSAVDFYVGSCGTLTLATNQVFTEVSASEYILEFWRPSGAMPALNVIYLGNTETVPPATFDPVCTLEACQVESIPTLSEWGIIVLSLIMLITGLVAVRQRSVLQE